MDASSLVDSATSGSLGSHSRRTSNAFRSPSKSRCRIAGRTILWCPSLRARAEGWRLPRLALCMPGAKRTAGSLVWALMRRMQKRHGWLCVVLVGLGGPRLWLVAEIILSVYCGKEPEVWHTTTGAALHRLHDFRI